MQHNKVTEEQKQRLKYKAVLLYSLGKKDTIHQVTKMLATSWNVLFPGHNHQLNTSTDDPSLAGARATIKVSGHQYLWLAGGYDLEIGHF